MARKKTKRKPGPPARYGRRPTLTIRLQEPLYEVIKASAAQQGKSLSEEIEDRLGRDAGWQETKLDINKMLAEAKAAFDAARVQALRVAGLMILRDIEGRPTRVLVDLETLLAEGDGVARAMRSGFLPRAESLPSLEAPRPMTDEEAARALEEIRRTINEAVARTRAADAAAESKDDDEAA
jgi:hypothetical protein